MESITKSKLTSEQINMMTRQAFGNRTKPEIITELADGYFNTAYMLTLTNGFKTVLKVSPPKEVVVMRYEKNIMETEVYVLNKIKSLGDMPTPKVFYYDQSGEIIKNDFFFMEFVDGVPLNKIRSELTEEQYREISSELGGIARKIHSIEGSYFGYISQDDKKFDTWDQAFLCMIKELLADAIDARVILPYDYDKIYNMIYEKREVLNIVKMPSLVHKDLWDGNIFIDPKTSKITGILDCERAIYGDALLDPVCGFLLNNKDFMQSYKGRIYLEKEEEIRAVLYQIYLYLIMVIECSYRKYPDENQSKWSSIRLEEALVDLLKL
ncbi:phosphotransferase family protein [Clostridium omnivorum]|uniref:Aminoglycoside phosphotransferase n=1 Tax=Clostridium omnivorum TaxID=1604902 RepID=A0ABQ5N9K4_9CLOT|nr:aminoglycoside phosphotransferase family protein [Clostridium sp. E14]GLC31720.1 aminoglycoside phosphotransferase [Clostridium sp. E14]